MNKEIKYTSNLNAIELLTIVFITLKLCNVITWSWFTVFIPMMCHIGIVFIIGVVVFMAEIKKRKDIW